MYRLEVNTPLITPSTANPAKIPQMNLHDPKKPNLRASFIIKMLLGPGVMDVIITYERNAIILINSPSFSNLLSNSLYCKIIIIINKIEINKSMIIFFDTSKNLRGREMEIRHLITFMSIVEIGSYTGAASKLGYTQSTITSHIQAIEEEIGGELFTYVKRNLQLTHIGRELIPLAEELLSTHEQIKNMRSSKEVKGVLRVAAPESLTISRLGPIIREFSLKYPHVKIVLTNGTCGQNQIDLISGKVDVAFMVYPELKLEKCLHYSLFEEKIVLVSSNEGMDHFDAYKKNNTKQFFITNEESCSYRTMFEKYLLKHDIDNFQKMELWSIEAIKKIVMSGLGFAVLPYITVKEEVDSGKLKIVRHNEKFEPFYSHMLIKKKKWLSPPLEAFVELVLNLINEPDKGKELIHQSN